MKLTEGLRRGDLNGMVLPLISVDEFSSKIDDRTVIVVAFYAFEEDPAHDLSNFLERSPENPLDTDVSPAPTREGYYVTFVELRRNKQFTSTLLKMVNEINNLTDVKQWQFTSQKLPKGKVLPLTEQNLQKWVETEPKPKDDKQKIAEWLSESALGDVLFEDDQICFVRAGVHHVYEITGMMDQVPLQAHVFTEHAVSESQRLERLLDGPYTVWNMADQLVVEHHHRPLYMVLKSQ